MILIVHRRPTSSLDESSLHENPYFDSLYAEVASERRILFTLYYSKMTPSSQMIIQNIFFLCHFWPGREKNIKTRLTTLKSNDGGKLEATIVSKVLPLLRELDDPIWELPPEMEYHGLHASLIVKGITKFHMNLLFRDSFGILKTSRFQNCPWFCN